MKRKNIKRQLILFMVLAYVSLFKASLFADVLLSDNFNYPDGLITNEYAFWNPTDPNAKRNPIWDMDSGSFFANGHAGWTGKPDDKDPNLLSTNGTNSAVFRLNTKRGDFQDVAVSFSLLNQGLTPSPSTPPVSWDGIHIWLHYQSEYKLYYASINRRDNTVVIKKKIPGGPSNGGTYYELTPYVPHVVPYNTWQQIKATVKTNANGTVTIQLFDGSKLLVSATDDGTIGGPPITGAGKVGIRGDNANLKFQNFTVTSLSGTDGSSAPSAPTSVTAFGTDSAVTVSWNPVSGATSYNLYRSRTPGVTKSNGFKVANVTSPKLNTDFVNGTRYYFVVTAVNAVGESVASSEVSAVAGTSGVPAPPSGVVAIAGNTQVVIKWNPVPGATSYNLYRSRSSNVSKTTGYKIEQVVSPKLNTGFTNGTKYYMVVTAVNAAGESLESARVSVTPSASLPLGSLAFGGSEPDNLDSVRTFPNPWKANLHGGTNITFDQLTRGTTVKIFTLSGECVKTLPARDLSSQWDLTNDSGQKVASGVYVSLITNEQGQQKRNLFTVIQ